MLAKMGSEYVFSSQLFVKALSEKGIVVVVDAFERLGDVIWLVVIEWKVQWFPNWEA